MNVVLDALLVSVSCGAVTGSSVVPLQWLAAGQLASPVFALATATLITELPFALACGVTGMVKLKEDPGFVPSGTAQVTN